MSPPVQSDALVFFGATGDLARKKLYPALYHLEARGRLSTVTLVNSMARRVDGDAQALVRIKAVDGAYPLVGDLRLDNGLSLADALKPADIAHIIAVANATEPKLTAIVEETVRRM